MKKVNLKLPAQRNNNCISNSSVLDNNTRCISASSDSSQKNGITLVDTIQELTNKLAKKDLLNRKRVICELGKTLHIKALQPLCNLALFDKDEMVRTIAISAIADIIKANHKKMQSHNRRTFVVHNVLNSWNKFPTLKYARAVRWFFSSINLDYENEEAIGLTKTILGKKCTLVCANIELQQVLDDICNTILSNIIEERNNKEIKRMEKSLHIRRSLLRKKAKRGLILTFDNP